jgi:hypothetical protein
MVYMGDVARIEFDSAAASAGDATTSAPQPTETSPRPGTLQSEPRTDQPRNSKPSDSQPREVGPPADAQPTPTTIKEPEPTQPEKPVTSSPPTNITPVSESPDTERATRKLTGSVKTVSVDVVGKRDWTSTGLIVKRGDRIRINSNGTVVIDPVSGRSTGPEGLADSADAKKLMPDQPTGALIGVIGADNDDFIFIGRNAEFTAARDGLLFLSVNEGNLADNTGTYKAVIEVQVQRSR